MATSQFSPFGLAPGPSYILTPAAWTALPARSTGYGPGLLPKENLNTAMRQSSSIATMIANFIAANQAGDVLDDGNLVALLAQFTAALAAATPTGITISISGTSGQIKFPGPSGLTIKWGTTPVYSVDSINIFSFPALGAVPGPFPAACFGVLITASSDIGVSGASNFSAGASAYTPSSFKLANDSGFSSFFYIAIGN